MAAGEAPEPGAEKNEVFLGTGAWQLEGLDWLGVPDGTPGGQIPVVQASSIGGAGGRGLFTTGPGLPAPVELIRDRSYGADGFVTDEESELLCEQKAPESEFLVCVVFGGRFGWLRDEFSGDASGALRPLSETLAKWIEEGRCSQQISWDEDEQCYTLADPLKTYVALNCASNVAAMANDALYGNCKDQAEYNVKDVDANNLVMVPCARPAEGDASKVEFKSIWLYPRRGWTWDKAQELTLGYGWEEVEL
eukprot:gb/GFBE01060509.1/.p1 GENE.gb/GFBE01060509.1/~~gb/GFBE01060509.1/.p1  ORF type:complete len:250 (+),score=56.06 gb/GFBE01060509.1/:1-750(+)